MPDPSTSFRVGPDQTAFSRVCPSCGRRVPRNVTTCRCGAILPEEAAASFAPEETPSGGGSSTALIAIIGVIALAAGGYWLLMRPTVAARLAAPVEQPAANPSSVPAPAAPTVSAEARAWDARATAPEAAQPASLPEARPLAPAPSTTPVSAAVEDMLDRVMPAVVLIQATGGRGSGFFVARDTLITNVHVVENDSYVTLQRADGSTMNARVESRAPAYDIAILKVAQPSPTQAVIPMASANALKPGQEIIVIGSALGTLQNSVSRGIVSALRSAGGATLVQTDAAINPGNSGGPMLDRNGSVIAISTMGYRNAEGLNFGVAIDHARELLEGRVANVGSALGLNAIQARGQTSESERLQQQGESQLKARLGQMVEAAGQLDAGWQRFRQQCFTSPIPGSYDHEWFAILVPRGMPANAASGCTSYYSSMESDVRRFKGLMQTLIADARRADVMPGTIRDVLRQNRLEFEWER